MPLSAATNRRRTEQRKGDIENAFFAASGGNKINSMNGMNGELSGNVTTVTGTVAGIVGGMTHPVTGNKNGKVSGKVDSKDGFSIDNLRARSTPITLMLLP